MKNIWKKLRDCWLDFWEDDELDMDKKHLSQHDKRSLLYGGFMIGVATFGLFSIGIIAGNIWTNHQNQKDMEEFLGTVVTYMATATDDEYEEIAQTIRHDLVYSDAYALVPAGSAPAAIRLSGVYWQSTAGAYVESGQSLSFSPSGSACHRRCPLSKAVRRFFLRY